MKVIADLADKMAEEISDAQAYIEWALREKNDDPTLVDVLYNLSIDEVEHHGRLHKQAVRLIEAYKEAKGAPPAGMLEMWNREHEKQVRKAAEIKVMQEMYKAS